MELLDLTVLIPALPLLGFALLVLGGRRLGEPLAGWLATAMMGGSFAAAVAVLAGLLGRDEEERQHVVTLFEWLPVGGLSVDVGLLADPLSIAMSLFVTGVGALIHLYSIGYMHGDENFSKFFVYMNLFAFSMLILVLGDNLLLTFLGWEGVGACSYFLISFWFTDEANASAGKKAFVTNRVGDLGFMLAIFLTFATIGSIDYVDIFEAAPELATVTATAIAVLLLVAATGKSAQLPLFVWLPDAMAGPTPVSALIHAATMVTSGVYLLTRMSAVVFHSYGWAPDVIAWVGALTAFFAATIAVSQNDIKRVLAYSTISQLGYMFLAVGVGAYVAAIFHMITHAFFKALLFLGAGSVIHGLHEEQDMRAMGGLRKYMPITAGTFIVGWLAIAGIPPFSGFWSKDEILLYAWGSGGFQGYALWGIGLVTALLTAFYMSRQVFMVFFGDLRGSVRADWFDRAAATAGASSSGALSAVAGLPTEGSTSADAASTEADPSAATTAGTTGEEAEALERDDTADAPQADDDHPGAPEPHESPWLMTVPLIALAGLAVLGGVINLPFTESTKLLESWLHPVLGEAEAEISVATGTKVLLAVIAAATGLVGIAVAAVIYLRRRIRPVEPELLARGWFYDSALAAFMGGPGRTSFEATSRFDSGVVDGAVDGVASAVRRSGGGLRRTQTGYVRNYALGLAGGAVVLLGYFLLQVI